jgi:hypothetical protein
MISRFMKILIDMCELKTKAKLFFFFFLFNDTLSTSEYIVIKVSKCKIIQNVKESLLSY